MVWPSVNAGHTFVPVLLHKRSTPTRHVIVAFRSLSTWRMGMAAFVLTVSLGDVVTTTIFAASAITFIVSIKQNGKFLAAKMDLVDQQNEMRFERIDAQIEDSKLEMKKLGDILVEL